MTRENNKRNGLEHVPACSTWPPAWLRISTLTTVPGTATPSTPAIPAIPKPEPPAASPWDLTPDLYERWEERVCIMHYDGGLPWPEAEAEALADVQRTAGLDAATEPAAPVTWPPDLEIITAEETARTFADADAARKRCRPRPGRKLAG
jgi:hypothetical protein